MGKRVSSPPRRPRDPVARTVRTPRFKQQVVPDKRWRERLLENEETPTPNGDHDEKNPPTD